jgi:plastocyanin
MSPKSYPSVATLALRAGDNVEWQKGGSDHSLARVSAKRNAGDKEVAHQ